MSRMLEPKILLDAEKMFSDYLGGPLVAPLRKFDFEGPFPWWSEKGGKPTP